MADVLASGAPIMVYISLALRRFPPLRALIRDVDKSPPRMATVLYVLAEVIRNLGLIIQPFTPVAAQKILDQVAVGANERDFTFIGEAHALKAGTVLPAPVGVFPRIMDEVKTA